MNVYVTPLGDAIKLKDHQWSANAHKRVRFTQAGLPDQRTNLGRLFERFQRRMDKLAEVRWEAGIA